jgi:hypothetical protein
MSVSTLQSCPNAQLFEALSKAQSSIETVIKRGEGEYAFATFDDVMSLVRPHLADNGLSITQFPDNGKNLVSIVGHKDGGYLVSTMEIPLFYNPLKNLNATQSWASAVTMARRYAVTSIFGMTAKNEDDDGAAAGATTHKAPVDEAWLEQNIGRVIKNNRWHQAADYFREQLTGDAKAIEYALKRLKAEADNRGIELSI